MLSSSLPGNPFEPDGVPRRTLASLFGLAPGGVYHAIECCHQCGALLPHHFNLTGITRILRRYIFCCTFRRLAPPRRYLAPWPKEPGLSSTATRTGAIVWSTLSSAMVREPRPRYSLLARRSVWTVLVLKRKCQSIDFIACSSAYLGSQAHRLLHR